MSDRSLHPFYPPPAQVPELIAQLSAVEAALEQSLGAGADAVIDARGHAHLLRLAQLALQQSENRFRTLVEHSTDGITLLTADATMRYHSPAVTRIVGYAPEELLGQPFLANIHPEDQAQTAAAFADLCTTPGKYVSMALRYRHKNGTYRWLEGTGTNLLDQPGVNAVLLNYRDVNERNEAEAARRESEERFQIIFNQSPLGIALVDPAGHPFLTNAACQKMMGRSAEELSRMVFTEFTHPEDRDNDMSLYHQLIAGERDSYQIEKRFIRKDGQLLWTSMSVTLIRDQAGQPKFGLSIVEDITGRKQAEAVLRLNSAALAAAANPIVLTKVDGAIVWANPAFTALTGYTLAEAAGLNPRDLVKSGRQEQAFYQQLWATVLAGGIWHGELVNRRKDGSLYHEEMTITPVRDQAGAITHFIAIKQDLTERDQALDKLRQSENQYRQLVESAPDIIYTYSSKRGGLYYSSRAEAVLGYPVGYLMAHPFLWQESIEPADLAEVLRTLQSLPSGGHFELEYRIKDSRGQWHWIQDRSITVQREGDELIMEGIATDITERRQAQLALRLSEENYRLLFENNPFPMWLYDIKTLQFLAVNEAALLQYGYTREEFLAMTIKDIRPAEEIPALLVSVHEGMARGPEYSEWQHRRKDGSIIRVEIFSRPFVYLGREARLVIASDITEKKQIQEKFLHAQRLESVGMLAAGIAHDLNNVLAPIMFAAPMLRESLTTSRDVRILNTIEQSATRGAGLVRQILGFVRTSSSEFQPTQVKHLARDVTSLMEETFPKSIRCEHSIPANLWPVLGNATQIHQVLMNLCVNARDAMPAGGTLRLTIANRRLDAAEAAALPGARPGAWLMLEVSDTGTGMTPDVLEKIWTPFFTTKDAGHGTGLGLSTVRSIALGHHGFVELHTAVGVGTTIRVFLPAIESEAAPAEGSVPPVAPGGHGEHLLVVDDVADIRESVVALLEASGYQATGCADGLVAITLFNAQPGLFSLVITDVDMPKLSGLELARTLRQNHPHLPILAMSGLSGRAGNRSDIPAIQTVASAFIHKPFKSAELLGALHALLHPPGAP